MIAEQTGQQALASVRALLADEHARRANKPIATAPRNGLSIIVGHPDDGEFVMHWNPTGTNALAQPGIGIWQSTDRQFTWSEYRGFGPSYWRELPA